MIARSAPRERSSATAGKRRDLTCGASGVFIWWLPTAALLALVFNDAPWLVAIWPPVLVFMGAMCLVNARGCGRTHCFVTGPFLLLLAAISLLYGLGLLPLGKNGWYWLAWTLLAGSLVLTYAPDRILGRYRSHPSAG